LKRSALRAPVVESRRAQPRINRTSIWQRTVRPPLALFLNHHPDQAARPPSSFFPPLATIMRASSGSGR
jgi:hypothetical protein